MALTPKDVDEIHETMKKLLEFWMRVKLIILRAFGNEKISREHESAFLQMKSDVSRTFRAVVNRLPAGLQFEGEKMIDMLKNAITMEHMRALPLNEKQNVFNGWHRIYIKMTRTYGALEVMKAGFYPMAHRKLMKSMDTSGKK